MHQTNLAQSVNKTLTGEKLLIIFHFVGNLSPICQIFAGNAPGSDLPVICRQIKAGSDLPVICQQIKAGSDLPVICRQKSGNSSCRHINGKLPAN
jgi:hypothetical protein